ncbi:MAG: L,D-transpeptidase family protein [Planctomycetota bacterium]|nr:MAG: L,D-transpeptidase family protein [Planctomycetota bacterium]
MARWFSRLSRRRRVRRRRWIYVISGLVIIILVVFIRGREPSSKDEGGGRSSDMSTAQVGETSAPVVATEPEPKLLEVELAPTGEPNPKVEQLIAEATEHLNAKPARIIESRDRLNEALPLAMSSKQRAYVKEQLSKLADMWLFSRTIYPEDRLCGAYEVKAGELLSTIGTKFKLPYEILLEINNISRAEALQAGETIKVINGPFHARIYRSTFTMDLYLQHTFVRSFPVGLGKAGMETPTGLWAVKAGGKLIKPTWTDPISGRKYESDDPDYPLGSRWVGLEGLRGDAVGRMGFAIHGTRKPEEIGTAGSQGCVRLHNGDAILVYNLLVPVYSRVEIVE